jgi:hypothetical protein
LAGEVMVEVPGSQATHGFDGLKRRPAAARSLLKDPAENPRAVGRGSKGDTTIYSLFGCVVDKVKHWSWLGIRTHDGDEILASGHRR